MKKGIATVSLDLIRRVYIHINRDNKQAVLLQNRKKWLKLTASLQVLEDSSWAIEYYCKRPYPNDTQGKYLYTYGLLQAIFLQQNAIMHICAALFNREINFQTDYPDAYKVRELRNDVVGHPTDRGGKYFVYLAQHSLSKRDFYYIKDNAEDGSYQSIDVDVEKAISDTAKCVNDILAESISQLDEEFTNYIDLHKERKMKDIFKSLVYAEEKTFLDPLLKDWGYGATKDMVEKCEHELELRYGSVETVDSYKQLLESIHKVYDLIDNGIKQCPYELQADLENALLENLFTKLKELETYCEETDQYFETYGEE